MKKVFGYGCLGIIGLFAAMIGIGVLVVVTIDADEQIAILEKEHLTLSDGMLACKTDEDCASVVAEFSVAVETPIRDLDLATKFGRNKPAIEELKKQVTLGALATCMPTKIKKGELSPAMGKLLCEKYKATMKGEEN